MDDGFVSRRGFVAGCAGGVAAAAAARAGLAVDLATVAPADLLADYVAMPDPSTAVEPLGNGEMAGVRWRTCRLTSQTWKDVAWTHELSMVMPADPQDTSRMLLWIDGGSGSKVPRRGLSEPTDAVKILAAVANASGLPAAVVRQVPYQPMFGDLHEDGLIAHTFVEYTKTGDPTWPLLLPMVKSAVEAMNAAVAQAGEHWGATVEEFVVTGASKRGWTTWLSAAVDERVKGIVPMVIDMLSLGKHLELQVASFGRMSEQLEDYTSRGIEKLFATPRGRELAAIVDPYAYRERYTMPKVIALGTNDPYWPLEACSLYYDGLPGPRWLSYCPNSGHGLPTPRVAALVAAMGRHVAGIEPLPPVDWRFDAAADGAECVVRCDSKPERVTLWTAASPSRDFRKARWSSRPIDAAGPEWRAALPTPQDGFAAGLVELEFARDPVPLVLTSGVRVVSSRG
ncbi:MAG: PhoPQ-activated pathogenicity-related family protein [Planctomycetaceae bacterium]